MVDKFVSVEPIFGTHEAGIYYMVMMSGEDAIYHGMALSEEQEARLAIIVQNHKHPWMQEYYRQQYPFTYEERFDPNNRDDKLGVVGKVLLFVYFCGGWYWSFKYYPDAGLIMHVIFGPLLTVFDLFGLFLPGDCISVGCENYLNRR